MDPITDIFNTMHVTTVIHSRIEATAPWGVAREEEAGMKATVSGRMVSPAELVHVGMVSRGNCWLSVDGIREPIPLTAGDCFLVAPQTSFILRDDPRTRPISFCELAPKTTNHVVRYGRGGAPTTIITAFLSFDSVTLKPMAQLLPGLILVKADQARTLALQNTLQLLASEIGEATPGAERVAQHLAEVLLIQILRTHIASGPANSKQGWLRAIFDPQIGAALRAIHEGVHKPWTVESLAGAAGMSRSAFALRFKELLRQTPVDYVTEWRMQKAIQMLQNGDKKLVEIAQKVGYESNATFSKAFKRVVGMPPVAYSKARLSHPGESLDR